MALNLVLTRALRPDPGDTPKTAATKRRLLRWLLQAVARELLPGERVARCFRVKIAPTVDVKYSPACKSAHYCGLMICGSVWHCPVCNSKISERKRVDLQGALDHWPGAVALVTVTLSHSRMDRCADLVRCFNANYRKLKSGRWWIDFERRFEIVGSYTATEITWSLESGFHPHRHVLVLSEKHLTVDELAEMQTILAERWQKTLAKDDRFSSLENGIDVRGGKAAASYVAKFGHEGSYKDSDKGWTVAHEVTKGGLKTGAANGHYSPFELLLEYALTDDPQLRDAWIEYALTMKGKHQLMPSRGLQRRLKLLAPTNDDDWLMVATGEPDDILLASLTLAQWHKVLDGDRRGKLLEYARCGDAEKLRRWLVAEKIIPE